MTDELAERERDIDLTRDERAAVAERQSASAKVIHEVIRRHGDEELERPTISLIWSGLAGGVAISASVIGQGSWRNIFQRPPGLRWLPAWATRLVS